MNGMKFHSRDLIASIVFVIFLAVIVAERIVL